MLRCCCTWQCRSLCSICNMKRRLSPGPQVYFKQADDLLRRLVTTRSRIADTEASIEVLLDQRRNGLVA